MKIFFNSINIQQYNLRKKQDKKGFSSNALASDVFQKQNISFERHCPPTDFKVKTVANMRCPVCGLTMMTSNQINAFVNEISPLKGQELADALEKYEDESVFLRSEIRNRHRSVYRPQKQKIVNIYKKLAVENPELDLYELTKLQANRSIHDLIEKQLAIIDKIENYVVCNIRTSKNEPILHYLKATRKKIKGKDGEETFLRKPFLADILKLIKHPKHKAQIQKIAPQMPTSDTDIDSFFVKYSHDNNDSRIIARKLVEQSYPTTEHLMPKSKGGDDATENYIVDCGNCNSSRGNLDFFEWQKNIPGFQRRLQGYMVHVKELCDNGRLNEEYYEYLIEVQKTISDLSRKSIQLKVPLSEKERSQVLSNSYKEEQIAKLKKIIQDLYIEKARLLKANEVYPQRQECIFDTQEIFENNQTPDEKTEEIIAFLDDLIEHNKSILRKLSHYKTMPDSKFNSLIADIYRKET